VWLLRGLGLELERPEIEEAAVELGLRLGPQRAQREHALAQPAAARREVDAHGAELLLEPARADAEAQASAGEHVERHREAGR
jgi:hypothetical protein